MVDEDKKPAGEVDESVKSSEEQKPTEVTKPVNQSAPDEAEKSEKKLVKIRSRNFVLLTKYLERQNIESATFLHTTKATIKRISQGK
jgi:hypothetical protein